MVRFGLVQDFRGGPPTGRAIADIYRECVDLAVAADELGFDTVWVSEHHFVADGFCPSPLVAAMAILARTSRIHVSTHALLLPMYHPVRVAEDVAVLDVLSGGRMELGVTAGYRTEEFVGLGLDPRQRWSRLDEACDLLLRAWTEEGWSHSGRHFEVQQVSVSPKPVQRPYPRLWVGATTPKAAGRAARLGAELLLAPPPFTEDEAAVYAAYSDGLLRRGLDPGTRAVAATLTCVVTDDPEAYRARHIELWQNHAALYRAWGARGDSIAPRRTSVIGDAAECAAALRELLAGPVPVTDVVMSLDAREQLERFAREVMPLLTDGVSTPHR